VGLGRRLYRKLIRSPSSTVRTLSLIKGPTQTAGCVDAARPRLHSGLGAPQVYAVAAAGPDSHQKAPCRRCRCPQRHSPCPPPLRIRVPGGRWCSSPQDLGSESARPPRNRYRPIVGCSTPSHPSSRQRLVEPSSQKGLYLAGRLIASEVRLLTGATPFKGAVNQRWDFVAPGVRHRGRRGLGTDQRRPWARPDVRGGWRL